MIAVLGSQALTTLLQVALFLPINFLIFFGPFLMMAVSQISAYEPGDADWGVQAGRRARPGGGQGGGARAS